MARFFRRSNRRGRTLARALRWLQGSNLVSPPQLSDTQTEGAIAQLLVDAQDLNAWSGAGLTTENEGNTLTRLVGNLHVVQANDLPTGVSAGYRVNWGFYIGTTANAVNLGDAIENPQGAGLDWIYTSGWHAAAHSAVDFTPEWLDKTLQSFPFDIRVQRKLRGSNELTSPYGLQFYIVVQSENLDEGESIQIDVRVTWRALIRTPERRTT